MTLSLLKSNIVREKGIIQELNILVRQLWQLKATQAEGAKKEIALLNISISNLIKQLAVVNDAIPEITRNIAFYQKLEEATGEKKKQGDSGASQLIKVRYNHPADATKKIEIGIKKKDKLKFLEGAALSRTSAKELEQKREKLGTEVIKIGKKAGLEDFFIMLSNKFFRKTADRLAEKKYFDNVNHDLRKISSPYILNSYIAMMLLSIVLSFALAIFFAVFFALLGIPALLVLAVLLGFPVITFLLFIFYPSMQRSAFEKGMNQELPFVTIYMAAVATSGIEPSKIFSILVRTKDYPFVQREIKRLLNYINFYGYDLVSALRQSSKLCPSERLAMLFNGCATTITSGGELTEFLNKHAEGLLFDYRLEREKYTKIAETFMDIYISILIAAPMIMMILFILLSLTGYTGAFFTPNMLSFTIVAIITILNIGFLLFLNTKQPKF